MKMGRSQWQNLAWGEAIATNARAAIAPLAAVRMALPMLCLLTGLLPAALAQASELNLEKTLLETAHCPRNDLSLLVTQLMLDLPSYSNRVIQRAGNLENPTKLYFMAAGQAEISQISLEAIADDPNRSRLPVEAIRGNAPAEEIYQIRFTTLERQYRRSSRQLLQQSPGPASSNIEHLLHQAAPSFQQFHWLILARQQDQPVSPWQIINLRSQLVPYPATEELLAPASDSRQGPVGKGLALWLRDWNSGSISLTAVNRDGSDATETESVSYCVAP